MADPTNIGERRGGLLDLVAVAAATYAMIVTTPIGGLVVRSFNWLTGSEAKTQPLIAYFATEGTGAGAKLKEIATPPSNVSKTNEVAKAVGLAPEIAHAVAVIAAGGGQDASGHYDVDLLHGGRASLASVGVQFPAKAKPAKAREEALIRGVALLEKDLGSSEAAVAATAVEIARVRFAVERARAGGATDPVAYRDLRPFLPPDDRDDADNVVHGVFALATAYSLSWPVDEHFPVSSSFGFREHPVLGGVRFHKGTDLAVPTGTEVRAIAEGVVVVATRDGVNGLFVEVDHGHGLTSSYCHNSELLVGRGDEVSRGRPVARSGSTGRSTGPHLHFQLEIDGRPVDAELFRQGAAPLARVGPYLDQRIARAARRAAVRWWRTSACIQRRIGRPVIASRWTRGCPARSVLLSRVRRARRSRRLRRRRHRR